MSGLFGGGKASIPTQRTIVAQPAKAETDAMANASRAAELRRRAAYGQSKTMLTSSDMAPATVSKKTLLGE
jgi:hypothetical protein